MGQSSIAQKVVGGVLDLIQLAIAITVTVLVIGPLTTNLNLGDRKVSCLLENGTSENSTRLCVYAIAVGIVSLLVNVVFVFTRKIFKCATCDAFRLSRAVDLVGDGVQTVWWGAAFAILVRAGTAANNVDMPHRMERDIVIGLSFGGMVAFAADIGVTIWSLCSS